MIKSYKIFCFIQVFYVEFNTRPRWVKMAVLQASNFFPSNLFKSITRGQAQRGYTDCQPEDKSSV